VRFISSVSNPQEVATWGSNAFSDGLYDGYGTWRRTAPGYTGSWSYAPGPQARNASEHKQSPASIRSRPALAAESSRRPGLVLLEWPVIVAAVDAPPSPESHETQQDLREERPHACFSLDNLGDVLIDGDDSLGDA